MAENRARSASDFTVAVIGKGMIGAAAARHLAQRIEGVALIGPDEPSDRAAHHDVFGSHYDEGRIYRTLDRDLIWASLGARSSARYSKIEAASGVQFYDESGFMVVGPAGSEGVEAYARSGEALGSDVERLGATDLAMRFPFLQFGGDASGALQARGGGALSPRRLVEAQTIAAERQGATILREPVHTLVLRNSRVEITTASGQTLRASKVLVATGGFANVHDVLPRKLDIRVGGRTIVLAEVDAPRQQQLQTMPSLVIDGPARIPDVYVLPPVRYPDGRWYVKLGSGFFEHPLETLDELGDWFRHAGAAEDREALHETLLSLIPALAGAPIHTDTCAVTSTVSGYPYIELIAGGQICVAVGGNGKAAKSSDEIGRLAADLLIAGEWRDDLPAAAFRAQFV